jgi:hypothetical protein
LNRAFLAAVVLAVIVMVVALVIYERPAGPARIELKGIELTVEMAVTPSQWSRGLSGRSSLEMDHGMLFVFDHQNRWAFWMKGMQFPLDVIWFDSNRSIIQYVESLQPCYLDDCPTFSPQTDALYALEVNAGFVAAHNLTVGDRFNFVG